MKYVLCLILILSTLFSIETTAAEYFTNFDTAVSQAKENHTNLLIIFSIEGCVYCEKLKAELSTVDINDKYTICIVDSTENKRMSRQRNIRRWPTSLIMDVSSDNIKESDRLIGYKSLETYLEWLNVQP